MSLLLFPDLFPCVHGGISPVPWLYNLTSANIQGAYSTSIDNDPNLPSFMVPPCIPRQGKPRLRQTAVGLLPIASLPRFFPGPPPKTY